MRIYSYAAVVQAGDDPAVPSCLPDIPDPISGGTGKAQVFAMA